MYELFSCFEYQIYKKGKFSIKLCKKVFKATCCFYSFNDNGQGAKWRYVGYFGSSLHPPGKRNLVAIMAQRHVLGT